jgi:hypothetical protein
MATNPEQPTSDDGRNADRPASAALRLVPLSPPREPSFPLLHPYLEVVYAPLLGPTAVLLARRLGHHLTANRGPVTVDVVLLARDLGVRATQNHPLGKRAALRRALDRLEHAHLVRWQGETDLGVLTGAPVLSDQTLAKLPASARKAHDHFLAMVRRGTGP